MKLRAKKAFTLVELMVVILILAILAALIVPKVTGRASDAKIAKAKSDLSEIHKVLTTFKLDCDRYPTTQEGLQALISQPANVKNWKGPYLDGNNINDPWGNPYVYEYPGSNGQDFNLSSLGSDGAPGGDGDAADIVDGQF